MKLSLKIKCCALLITSWLAAPAFAQQNFRYKAAVQQPDSSRFYSITLQPGLTAKCRPDLADLRLKDEKGNTVPYLPGNVLPARVPGRYQQLPEVLIHAPADSLAAYIAENKSGLGIDQLWLKLRNTAVNRSINLLGSDDLQHWFAIQEHIMLRQTLADRTGTFEELITFPVSTYRYFKVQVNDRNRAPVAILQAGVYIPQQAKPDFVPLPSAKTETGHKADSSFISLTFNEPYRINRLQLQVAAPQYYQRTVRIYSINGKHKVWLEDTVINSGSNGVLSLSAKTSRLQLIVLNGDNPPLQVKSVQAYQLRQSLVAYLEKQHHYALYFSNNEVRAPQYDLRFFADSIRSALPVISHQVILQAANPSEYRKQATIPAWALWVAGGLALSGLLALTLRMAKEVSKTKT